MNLRTPRRRISPRTKRKYRIIREFFRRALGSSSQQDIKISSSIAINVSDLKRKIVGLEYQLNEVNKHCQNIACLDCTGIPSESCTQADLRHVKQSDCCILTEPKHEIQTIKEQTESSTERNLENSKTKFLYKSSNGQYRKSSITQYGKSEVNTKLSKTQDVIDANQSQAMINVYDDHVYKAKTRKSKLHRLSDYGAKLHNYRTRSVYENFPSANSSSSFRSLVNPRIHHSHPGNPDHLNDMKYLKQEYAQPLPHYRKEKKYKEHAKITNNDVYKESYEQKPNKTRKQKHHNRELDQDFISDIIKRQYRPVKMFGRKQSDLSQISAPVCRDQEYSIREDLIMGPELCSCCRDEQRHHKRHSDLSEMRSICDTRLYSSKKHHRGKHRRPHQDKFNYPDAYDYIPVKEKSSPKTRRKFNEDNMFPYEYYYREVPPSPRTLRPRLNLKSQYNTDFEDYMAHIKRSCRKGSPYRRRCARECVQLDSDVTSEQVPNFVIEQPRKTRKHMPSRIEKQGHCRQDNATMISIPNLQANDQVNNTMDTTFNKNDEIRGEKTPVDKTDKALCEIKDILQSFLHEIKKETIASQCDKSEASSKTGDNGMHLPNENNAKLNGNILPNSRHQSINNFGAACNASPYMTAFQNPCCYPVMPVCPMNCPMTMPNGYMMPSPSYTCTNCFNTAKESTCNEHCCNKNTATTCHTENGPTETENLIKEIYKFVAQGPVKKKDFEDSIDKHNARKAYAKLLTSRSVGASSRFTNSKHDVKVGTPPLKCYSKSCEAIGSRIITDPYSSITNASYSDTVLEKLSLGITQSTSETGIETSTSDDKSKRKNFSSVLRSIGLLKKKKKDVIEELSESESAIDVEVKTKSLKQPRSPGPPYRQDIANYMMHGQEYYNPPPMPSHYPRPHEYQPDYNPPYNPGLPDYSQPPPLHDMYAPRAPHPCMREQAAACPYASSQRPTAPPFHTTYDNPYKPIQQPQVPLCLKEIEVKSTATQSDRKMSIFRKLKKKMQAPAEVEVVYDQNINTCSTQTQATPNKPPPRPPMKPLINWKKLQAKAMAEHGKLNTDPMKFSLKTETELAEGDLKIRNVMLKKLFYKRNPFSPRNLIVRTLLGKDKSSYGNPKTTGLRPRMFL